MQTTSHTPDTVAFIKESNRIEGITREPTEAEIQEHERFMAQDSISIADMVQFVRVYQPDAQLRNREHLNVRIGNYYPPRGGEHIIDFLQDLLNDANNKTRSAYLIHKIYEMLHPFTDGNGRSGRMLWLWMMREAPLGFLHTWYYQSLDERVNLYGA